MDVQKIIRDINDDIIINFSEKGRFDFWSGSFRTCIVTLEVISQCFETNDSKTIESNLIKVANLLFKIHQKHINKSFLEDIEIEAYNKICENLNKLAEKQIIRYIDG